MIELIQEFSYPGKGMSRFAIPGRVRLGLHTRWDYASAAYPMGCTLGTYLAEVFKPHLLTSNRPHHREKEPRRIEASGDFHSDGTGCFLYSHLG